MVAGALVGAVLADFGADLVKVEQPGTGDPLRLDHRRRAVLVEGLRAQQTTHHPESQGPARTRDLQALLPQFDVVVESFTPGTLEGMGLGWDNLHAWHPGLILLRISAWGQSGPGSARPGFGTLVEAASGFAAMNGEADGGPIVPSFPLADMTAGLTRATRS